jgi:hypothetical protein
VEYEILYRDQVLSKLDPQKVYDDLGEDAILLCHEKWDDIKSGKAFCHRRIVAEWLEEELGIEVPELEDVKQDLKKHLKKYKQKGLQSVYNQIINILKENNVLINITPPRPYLIKKDDEERINAEAEDLFKKCKIKKYNSKMKEKEAYKLYFDEAYKYTSFYEEGDE